ncbi:SpoIIE family protein phosphatase [Streptomyces sp. NPDC006529]|uniref:SpoIIE family protein phosphatase n=1 Tax=Streptomyces sp. NPDC006529 TaxID=3157177 RepID=UPI0033BB9CCF
MAAQERGVPVEIAKRHDNWPRLGLSQAGPATCRQVEIPETVPLILLVTDGVSDQVNPTALETLCRLHATDPQALAGALVAAVKEDGDGYRDDATVIAMLRCSR